MRSNSVNTWWLGFNRETGQVQQENAGRSGQAVLNEPEARSRLRTDAHHIVDGRNLGLTVGRILTAVP
jgi:hypothetical protein